MRVMLHTRTPPAATQVLNPQKNYSQHKQTVKQNAPKLTPCFVPTPKYLLASRCSYAASTLFFIISASVETYVATQDPNVGIPLAVASGLCAVLHLMGTVDGTTRKNMTGWTMSFFAHWSFALFGLAAYSLNVGRVMYPAFFSRARSDFSLCSDSTPSC